ncbi:MAG: LuxR C-terminal-related transcriptional regulator [Elainellaceae cyanobacterium]
MNNFISAYIPPRSPIPNGAPAAKEHRTLLQEVVEGLPDGFLILTRDGGIVGSNSSARAICRQLGDASNPINDAPQAIWQICVPLLKAARLSSEQALQIEGTVGTEKSALVRVRARWLQPDKPERILVLLEDKYQSARQRALLEGTRCGLTTREVEVFLYRCIDYTYEEIALELQITVNTVKKHVKSINSKRDACPSDISA